VSNQRLAISLQHLRPNSMRQVELNGLPVLICRVGDEVVACDALCIHESEPLAQGRLRDHILTCIYHEAQFDVRTGMVVQGPAARPLRTFAVCVLKDDVFVEVRDS
jgi:nitrite reductase/ring-hydroxylating ferredoxin subunit